MLTLDLESAFRGGRENVLITPSKCPGKTLILDSLLKLLCSETFRLTAEDCQLFPCEPTLNYSINMYGKARLHTVLCQRKNCFSQSLFYFDLLADNFNCCS